MTFFSIVPRSEGFFENMSNAIKLKVITDSGINTKPNLNINVTDMSKGYKHFYNSGSVGITFEISVIINKDEKVNGKSLVVVLDEYIRNMTPLLIKTDAIDIPTSKKDSYIIVANDSRKQQYRNHTKWDLKFMTYTPLSVFKYANNNAGVKAALKKMRTKSESAARKALKKCGYKVLKYSKKKKTVDCVRTLQKILKKNKCYSGKIDGWFGKSTTKAVKKFQKNYNKKHVKSKTTSGVVKNGAIVTANKKTKGSTIVKITGLSKLLPTNGKVDKLTWKVLCKS